MGGIQRTKFNAPWVLVQSATAVELTGTTSNTVLKHIVVPAGVVDPDAGQIIVNAMWMGTTSVNNKTCRAALGGLQGESFNITNTGAGALTGAYACAYWQALGGGMVATVPGNTSPFSVWAYATSNIDLTQAQPITFSGQLAIASEMLTLRWCQVLVSNP